MCCPLETGVLYIGTALGNVQVLDLKNYTVSEVYAIKLSDVGIVEAKVEEG
jgi:hypothetical protein